MNPDGGARKRGQMASEIEKAMQQILARGLADPRIKGLITVTKVELTEDRREAKIAVSVLPEDAQDLTMHGLKAATGHLRKQAMERVRSRFFPRIEFVLDESIKRQTEVLSLIHRASEEAGPADANGDSDASDANHDMDDGQSGTGSEPSRGPEVDW